MTVSRDHAAEVRDMLEEARQHPMAEEADILIEQAVAELDALAADRLLVEREREQVLNVLPYHGCSVCRGAERGPDGVPCANCHGTGEEPSLANLVESNLQYFEHRAERASRERDEANRRADEYADRGDFLVYRGEYDRLKAAEARLAEVADRLREEGDLWADAHPNGSRFADRIQEIEAFARSSVAANGEENDTPGFDAGFEVGGTMHKPPTGEEKGE